MEENQNIEIERKLSFQEDLINELSQIVARQDLSIMKLEKSVVLFARQLKEFTDNSSAGAGDEKPPHY